MKIMWKLGVYAFLVLSGIKLGLEKEWLSFLPFALGAYYLIYMMGDDDKKKKTAKR